MYKLYQIDSEIVRLTDEYAYGNSLTERYGLLDVPEAPESIDFDGIAAVNGRAFSVQVRPEKDDALWQARSEKLNALFQDKLLNHQLIAGDPSLITDRIPPETPHKGFGISVRVDADERFYGLGEAKRDGINLRGGIYQNWVVYQQNEISIPFLMSDAGWGLFINCPTRHFVDVCGSEENTLTVLGEDGTLDIFFITADSMKGVLSAFTRLTGRPVLLPKYAYGLTYIAPIYATQADVLADARELRSEHIPCDHISLEPGWMSKTYDFSVKKDWNMQRFHMPSFMAKRNDPRSFISALRRYGFHVSLWTCVDYDTTAEEERVLTGAEECTPEPFYRHLSRFVGAGVDGFKVDPCSLVDTRHLDSVCANGRSEMEMHNLQNTFIMKQLYTGFRQQMNFRPMLHYCGGYIGIQRYCACTTGDNGGRQGALTWILNLAMSGCMNATCDMDVHTPESIHFAMLVPWAHLNNWTGSDQPWWAGETQHQLFIRYARLRYHLLPYLYACALEGHETGVPMLRPMPLQYPSDARLADTMSQYMLGDQIMTTVYSQHVIFPEGEWVNYFTGEIYKGGAEAEVPLTEGWGGGLFVRRGAIIPCQHDKDYVTDGTDETIEVHIWLREGTERYCFREDDGISFDCEAGGVCKTDIECTVRDRHVRVSFGRRNGDYAGKGSRVWQVIVHGEYADIQCDCNAEDKAEIIK